MIAILDYEAGNQTSVRRALDHLGIPCAVTADPKALERASGVIFPGVGAAGQAMGHLKRHGLDAVIKDIVARETPLLGICLGCQILLESSEEDGGIPTLGIMPGVCRRFDGGLREEDGSPVRIPHMGWNGLNVKSGRNGLPESPLLRGIEPDAQFYFVHSYYVSTDPSLVLTTTRYGIEFCTVYGRDGLWGAQFHPEKSGAPGLRLLRNFCDYSQGSTSC